jgi:hypothetical protein
VTQKYRWTQIGLFSAMFALLIGCSFIVQTPAPEILPAADVIEIVPTGTPEALPTAEPTNTAEPLPEITASFGTLLVKSAEFTKTFPPGCTDFCMEPISSGHVFLVVIFESKEGGNEAALGQELGKSSLWSQVSVVAGDGYRATAGGGGMFPELFLEFSVPEGSDGLVLTWGDNPPIPLTIE